ncbi:unnamed protein product [Oikopleura dioica]|uniref:Uncharacterized protein n=1 Tax=Oikopleura dioica TaxID=34765 RepID=E4X662_OIKDI|nr:unnamed protein product [Oikopleura dioica]
MFGLKSVGGTEIVLFLLVVVLGLVSMAADCAKGCHTDCKTCSSAFCVQEELDAFVKTEEYENLCTAEHH